MTEALPVRLEKDGDIGVIIVNYPPVNALGPGSLRRALSNACVRRTRTRQSRPWC